MHNSRLQEAAVRTHRALAVLALVASSLSCGDGATAGPGIPSAASLAVAPSFQAAVAGGPVIVLERVEGWLVPIPEADSTFAAATFVDGEAALQFDVLVTGPGQRFVFRLDAFDTAEERVFASTDTIDVKAGESTVLDGVALDYVARDAAVTDFSIDASSVTLAIGDTVHLTALACCGTAQELFTVKAGWSSRDPLVATVDQATGVVTATAPGRAWMVATLFNGAMDSTEVAVGSFARTWIGGDIASPSDWMTGANWSPRGTPAPGDTALVPITSSAPVLLADATVASLTVARGASLRVDGALTVTGDAAGEVTGAGTLTVQGDFDALSAVVSIAALRLGGGKGTTLIGAFGGGHSMLELFGKAQPIRSTLAYRDVRVTGSASLAGPEPVTFDGLLAIEGDAAELAPNGTPLTVTGDLITGLGGVLALRNDADDVIVKGGVKLDGGPTDAALLYGTLHVGRDFAVVCKTAECFAPGANGSFTVQLDGTEPQTVSLALPGTAGQGGALQHFRSLRVSNAAGVTFATGTPVLGGLSVDSASLATIPAGAWVDVAGTLFVERSGSMPGRIDNFGELYAADDQSGGTVKPNPVLTRK